MRRRTLLETFTATAVPFVIAATGWLPAASRAEEAWPSRPIRIIDAFAPGGSTDVVARLIGTKLSARVGQPVIVENKQGAGGSLGSDAVAKAKPDGYTLLLASTALPTSAATGKKLPYDLQKDLVSIGLISAMPLLIVVPADSPIKALRDLVDTARAKPNDGIRYGSSGVGSMSHIGMELLAADAKVQMLHVPYKGVSSSVSDLLGGQLQALLGTVATHSSLLESGKLRGIVVTSPQRSPFLPNLPTSAESGFPKFEIEYWWGVMGPAGMPPEIVKRLNQELNAILALPDVIETLARFGATPKAGTPEELGRINALDLVRWTKLIKDANIQVE